MANLAPPYVVLDTCTIPGPDDGSEIHSWGVPLTIGRQQACFGPSTVVNTTLVTSSDLCLPENLAGITRAQCLSRRGGHISIAGLNMVTESTLGTDNSGWATIMDGFPPFKYAIKEPLKLRRDDVVTMVEGIISQGQNHTASHLGLGEKGALLEALLQSGRIRDRVWSLNAGSRSVLRPRPGNLVLGGIDDASVKGSWFEYPMTYPKLRGSRLCPLQVEIKTWIIRMPNRKDASLVEAAQSQIACIEPYDNLFRFPGIMLQNFKNIFGNSVNWTEPPLKNPDPNMLVLEPGLAYPSHNDSTATFNASFVITLAGGFPVTIPSYEIQRPLRGLAVDGRPIINEKITELQVYAADAPADAPILPSAFLSQVYLSVDYDRNIFKLASINEDATTPNPVYASPMSAPGGLNSIAIGLIVVAILLFLVIFAVLFLYRRIFPREAPSRPLQEQAPQSFVLLRRPRQLHVPRPIPAVNTQPVQLPNNEVVPQLHGNEEHAAVRQNSVVSGFSVTSPVGSNELFTPISQDVNSNQTRS